MAWNEPGNGVVIPGATGRMMAHQISMKRLRSFKIIWGKCLAVAVRAAAAKGAAVIQSASRSSVSAFRRSRCLWNDGGVHPR